MKKILEELEIEYLLVNSTNKFLVEYPYLSENARYTLTGFTGSTGDALVTKDNIYLFVDGRYHIQAEQEAKSNINIIKLQIGQKQDEEIRKLINPNKVLGIVAKKVSQQRLDTFKGYKIKLLETDPINDFVEEHSIVKLSKEKSIEYKPTKPTFISNLEEVSYITGLRDFSRDCSSKIWQKLFINGENRILFSNDIECDKFLSTYEEEIIVDKSTINAHDYSLLKKPIHESSNIRKMKSIKSEKELINYKKAFKITDNALMAIRNFIENNEFISEYDIAKQLRQEFINNGAKSLSFNSIVAINKNSALAHYSKNSKNVFLENGDLVLIDCGMYDESGLATDITRVFVKEQPNQLQKRVYTLVLKAFLNCFNSKLQTGYEIDSLAHSILDNAVEGFVFNHGLGHGIGINVHESPPNLSQNDIAKYKIEDGMTFTIEPGLYNKNFFGIRLENSCYKQDGKIYSFVKMGYEGKLIDKTLLDTKEIQWLKDFNII